MENEIIAGNEGTATQTDAGVTVNDTPNETVTTQTGQSKPERTFTQTQLNDIMKRRVERSHNAFFNRYGVKNLEELDNLIGKSRSYDPLNERFSELEKNHGDLETQFKDLTEKYGYKACNINEQKIDDIRAYFKGKGLDINEEMLIKELKTHPDWANKVATIQQLGAEASMKSEADERAEAARIFGVKL